MNPIDWIILFATLLFIVIYGVWKTRGSKNIEGYLLGDKSMKWWTIGLSIMATQASAITFLSTPGQAFADGMRFIQFYFGLPLAMVILSITAIPIYYKLKVYTAYEYLESRFDLKTRSLAAFLFLIQRGLGAGITIYAPSIILSSLIGWNLYVTNILIGSLVIIYTVSGGTKAVSVTQKYQMAIMMGGMLIAGIMVINYLPEGVSLGNAVSVAGEMGKMNVVNLSFDLTDRYNIWSGLLGGMFLMLAYFGTDQSQVARYLSGKSITESRLGLLFNGLLKIPMQFIILFIGVMVFVFYLFYQPPVFFNKNAVEKIENSSYAPELDSLTQVHDQAFEAKRTAVFDMVEAIKKDDEVLKNEAKERIDHYEEINSGVKTRVSEILKERFPEEDPEDTDYVFMSFVKDNLPQGLIGLLFAVIFSAAMSSTSSELNALASTTTVDVYKRSINKNASDEQYLRSSRLFTLGWGLFAIGFATFATKLENLIQAVNILGSLFYGTILGIFLVAFYIKYIKSRAVFIAALFAEAIILYLYFYTEVAYLLFNLIAPVLVVFFGFIIQIFLKNK